MLAFLIQQLERPWSVQASTTHLPSISLFYLSHIEYWQESRRLSSRLEEVLGLEMKKRLHLKNKKKMQTE